MTKQLTARMKRLVDKAQIVPYTTDELKLLLQIVEGVHLQSQIASWTQNKEDSFDYDNLIWAVEEGFQKKGSWIDRPSDQGSDFKCLNLFQYLLVYYRKIFLFLTCVDRKMVLTYMGRGPLNMFVEWRLKIGK